MAAREAEFFTIGPKTIYFINNLRASAGGWRSPPRVLAFLLRDSDSRTNTTCNTTLAKSFVSLSIPFNSYSQQEVFLQRRAALAPRLVLLGLVLSSCGSDGPTGSGPALTAPTVREPATGATVTSSTPTLTVGNATGASGLRYRFEVASDSAFGAAVAVGDDVPEGAAGTTSWTVTESLDPGATYYWRARASSSVLRALSSAPSSR